MKFLLALTWASLPALAADVPSAEPPTEWIDPATGHRVVRLSREPGSGNLYFHQNAYSADGQKLVITTPSGLSTVNLKTHEIDQIVKGRVTVLVTGRKTGQIYYTTNDIVYATDLDTHAIRQVAKLPPDLEHRGNLTVNADETMLVGLAVDLHGKAAPRQLPAGERAGRLGPRWAEGLPMVLYTINIKTGEVKKIHTSNDWLNHLQCSPMDPNQIMFCHEGPWHLVDRIWTIRVDGSGLTKIHTRMLDMEIAGHEFFSADGKTIWYDLQTPRSGVFWLAGYNLETGERTWYHLERNEWSVHYNASPDGKLFAGDGGGPSSVAAPGNGQWIYLFRPEKQRRTGLPDQSAKLIKTGVFKSERLVDLSRHDYSLEPNVSFAPDGKWVVFSSLARATSSPSRLRRQSQNSDLAAGELFAGTRSSLVVKSADNKPAFVGNCQRSLHETKDGRSNTATSTHGDNQAVAPGGVQSRLRRLHCRFGPVLGQR